MVKHFVLVCLIIALLGEQVIIDAQDTNPFNSTYLSYGEPPLSQPRWSPVGDVISVAGDGEMLLFTPDFTLLKIIPVMPQPEAGMILHYAWSPDGTMLAISVSMEVGSNWLVLWDMMNGQQVVRISDVDGTIIAWSPDSQYVAVDSVQRRRTPVYFFDRSGRQVYFWEKNIEELVWNPNGHQIATMNGDVKLWNITKFPPQLEATLVAAYIEVGFAYNSDGTRIALLPVEEPSSEFRTVIYDTTTHQEVYRLPEQANGITEISWGNAPLITYGFDETIVWNVQSGAPVLTLQGYFPDKLDWHPDGDTFVTYTREDGIHIRDAATGEILARLCDVNPCE